MNLKVKDKNLRSIIKTFSKIHAKLCDTVGRKFRIMFRNKRERSKLTNRTFTLFAQNCIGSVMYHDLGQQFRSPTINMLCTPKDFIRFMKDIHWFLEQPIRFLPSDKNYPVGEIGGVQIDFVHYHSENEVLLSWEKRIKRINWDNVFVLCCDEGLTDEDIMEFDRLPYKNKILFTHKKDVPAACGVYSKTFKDKTDARLLEFCSIFGKRYYQRDINYVKWLNEGNYWN